jgi:hypothetical protein
MAYKKIFFFVALTFFICPAAALADVASRADFNGTWIGSVIHDDDGYVMDVRIDISSGGVTQFFSGDDGWRVAGGEDSFYLLDRNNLFYVWVNQGGIWTETQTFSLSFINSNTLDVVWTRHVNNYAVGSSNDTWHLTGQGRLRKDG